MTDVLIVCGSGGVGKTTMSAALGLNIARRDSKRVLVITVDPARRLASALGVTAQGNDVIALNVAANGGSVSVSMLDTKQGWDALVARHAPTSDVARRVLNNTLYQNITERFVNSHDYIAIERLHEVVNSGEFDVVVVDTPPSRNALGVLDAPERMRDFFASRLLRWLTVPTSSRVFGLASRPFFALADKVLGARFLSDVTEFFSLFMQMEPGFVRHATEVEAMLRGSSTKFIVVTTPEHAPLAEAEYLLEALRDRGFSSSGLIVNRMLPEEFCNVFAEPVDTENSATEVIRLLDVENYEAMHLIERINVATSRLNALGSTQAQTVAELRAAGIVVTEVPELTSDVDELDAIVLLSDAFKG